MKLNNSKYNTYAAYALIVISFGLLYAAFIFNLPSVFALISWFFGKIKCVFYAVLFAFISVPPMRFFERFLTRHVFKTKRRLPPARVLAAHVPSRAAKYSSIWTAASSTPKAKRQAETVAPESGAVRATTGVFLVMA